MPEQPSNDRSASVALGEALGGIERDAEVPIGVQIAWALRARIGDGTLRPGERLPGLRELAEATGVNVNTARSVYQRLEHEGLIESQQGSGTFVASEPRAHSAAAHIAASAAHEAHDNGVQPRDVAAALYVLPESPLRRRKPHAERRRVLRTQIAALELAAAELEAEHPGAAQTRQSTQLLTSGPRLLSVEELELVRTALVRRLAAVQRAIDEPEDQAGSDEAHPAAQVAKPAKRRSARQRPRPAPAGT